LGIKWPLEDTVLSVFERLIDLLNYPIDIVFLASLIQQEIYYRLLMAQQGEKLQQLVVNGSHTHRITQATDWLKTHLSELVVIEDLASSCWYECLRVPSIFQRDYSIKSATISKNLTVDGGTATDSTR